MLRILLVNTSSNLLLMFIKLAATFVMTPIFVRNLGNYDYGLWEMIVGIIGYMGMLDLGIRPAISRFASKYQALNDNKNLNLVFSSTLTFMFFVGLILLVFFSLWGFWFSSTLSPTGEAEQRYTLLLLILAAQLLFEFPGYVAESYLEGFQKYYLKNYISIISIIVSSIILYNNINPENGIVLLAGVSAIAISIKYVFFFFILAHSRYGGIRYSVRDFSRSKLVEVVKFGFKSFIQGIATRVEVATDTLIIGFFLGPAIVPFYSIPANLVQHLRTIGWTLTHAFMPLFSNLDASSKDEEIKKVYLLSSKYIVGLILAMSCGVAVIAGPFLSIWIGEEFQEKGEIIIYFLIFFTAFPFLNPLFSRYLTAIGQHGILAKLMPISALINIVLSLILVESYGIVGVAFASTVPVLIFVPLYLHFTCRHLGVTIRHYIQNCIVPCVIPTIFLTVVAVSIRKEWLLDNYTEIIATVIASGMVWLIAFWLTAMSADEKEVFINYFKEKFNISR